MARVIHFEIPASDPARVLKFYQQVFEWRAQKWEGPLDYWLVQTGEGSGIDGGIMPRQRPSQGTVNTIDVPSVDETLISVQANGGRVVEAPMAVPGVGRLAYCQDPEGNVFGIMQRDQPAK